MSPRDSAITTSPRVPDSISSPTTGIPSAGESMSMPARAIIVGIEPRDAMPMSAHAVQSMTMPRVSGPSDVVVLARRSLAAL